MATAKKVAVEPRLAQGRQWDDRQKLAILIRRIKMLIVIRIPIIIR